MYWEVRASIASNIGVCGGGGGHAGIYLMRLAEHWGDSGLWDVAFMFGCELLKESIYRMLHEMREMWWSAKWVLEFRV